MITRRNFITGLLASVSGLLGAGAGWFGRKAVSMSLPILYGTYIQRLAYSASDGQWWFQTDVGMDGANTYASGYYLWDNSEWGYFAGAGTTANFVKTIFATGESPVIGLHRYTNNPGIARTTINHIVRLNETGTVGSGVDEAYVVWDTNNVQVIGGVGFIINGTDANQNGVYNLRIRGPESAAGTTANVVYSLTSDLLQYYKWRGGQTQNAVMYGEVLKAIQYNSGSAIASTTTETSVFGSVGGSLTFPADFFNDTNGLGIARSFEVYASGIFGTTATPTSRLRLFLGGSVICDTTALTMPNTVTNVGWWYHALVTCQATGASGSFRGQGRWDYHTSTAGAPSTAAVTLDTTGTLAIDLMQTWGTNNASNTFQCTNAYVRVLA